MKTFSWFTKPDVIARAEHMAILSEKDALIVTLRAELADWKQMVRDALTPKPVSESSFAPLPPAERPPKKPDIVQETIRELASGDLRMMKYLHQEKRRLRREHPNMSDDLLCVELSKWESSEDSFAESV